MLSDLSMLCCIPIGYAHMHGVMTCWPVAHTLPCRFFITTVDTPWLNGRHGE